MRAGPPARLAGHSPTRLCVGARPRARRVGGRGRRLAGIAALWFETARAGAGQAVY